MKETPLTKKKRRRKKVRTRGKPPLSEFDRLHATPPDSRVLGTPLETPDPASCAQRILAAVEAERTAHNQQLENARATARALGRRDGRHSCWAAIPTNVNNTQLARAEAYADRVAGGWIVRPTYAWKMALIGAAVRELRDAVRERGQRT